MIYLLDTSALLVMFRKEPGAEKVAEVFADPSNEVLLCALSVAEFGRKMREMGMGEGDARNVLDTFIPMFTAIVAVDDAVARASLSLIEKMPTRLPLADSLIAAAAVIRAACLVHRDKHLAVIPGTILQQVGLFL